MKPTPPAVRKDTATLAFTQVVQENPDAVLLRLETGRSVWVGKHLILSGWQPGKREGGHIQLPGWLAERLH